MTTEPEVGQTPDMANRKCWHCNVTAHMTRVGDVAHIESTHDGYLAQGTYTCDECGWLQIASLKVIGGFGGTAGANANMDSGSPTWYPERGYGSHFPDVPEEIATAADEAHRCYSIQAYRGAVAIARAVIEASAKNKGIVKGQIHDKIEELAKAGHIREHIREAAHEVRFLGNEVAHGDFVDPVDPGEAEDILALMGEVLQEVFQSPARVARVKANREAKKAAGGT